MARFLKFLLAVLIFLTPQVVAYAETKSVSITVSNPDGPISESKAIFVLPFGVSPVNLPGNASFNEATRELAIDLGKFASKESKVVSFILDGPAGQQVISGKIVGKWPASGIQPEENFELAIQSFAVTFGVSAPSAISSFLDELQRNPELNRFAENVAKPVSVILGAAGAGAIAASAFSASASFASGLARFFSFFGFAFLRFRRQKPWGRVYNHLTGKPVDGARVRVLDSKFRKIKESQITDKDGRFGFLVAPGDYYLKVSNRGFAEKETDKITITGPIQALNLEIALNPLEEKLTGKGIAAARFWHGIMVFINSMSPWLLGIGALFSLVNAFFVPVLFNFIVGGIYVLLIILKIALREVIFKSFGWVLDNKTEKPLDLTVVRLFDANKNWLLATRVSDHEGRFNFLIAPGDYYLTAAKDGYKPFQSQTSHFTKSGIISYDIKLEQQI